MAQSGRRGSPKPCPLSGVKRTSQLARAASANDPKRTRRRVTEPQILERIRRGERIVGMWIKAPRFCGTPPVRSKRSASDLS